jgi:hypothetical protein
MKVDAVAPKRFPYKCRFSSSRKFIPLEVDMAYVSLKERLRSYCIL